MIDMLLPRYQAGKRDFHHANLSNSNLRYVDLSTADLHHANLRHVDLHHARLHHADLHNANLCYADLRYADLRYADLRYADLRYADLRYADLYNADLCGTVLHHANLTCTVLDPKARIPYCSDEEITTLGLELDVEGGREVVRGWRTAKSQYIKGHEYVWGWYNAPVFSVDTTTACHPGIYLASRRWLERPYSYTELVRCWCYRDEMVVARRKARAKWLYVV